MKSLLQNYRTRICWLAGVTLLGAGVLSLIISPVQTRGQDTKITEAISLFWQEAVAGGTSQRSVTSVPATFFDFHNKCLAERVESDSGQQTGPRGFGRGVDEQLKTDKMDDLRRFIKKISNGIYSKYRIVSVEQNDTEAEVKLAVYEPEFSLNETTYLLLTRIDGDWKVFSNTSKFYIEEGNPNFARSVCQGQKADVPDGF